MYIYIYIHEYIYIYIYEYIFICIYTYTSRGILAVSSLKTNNTHLKTIKTQRKCEYFFLQYIFLSTYNIYNNKKCGIIYQSINQSINHRLNKIMQQYIY